MLPVITAPIVSPAAIDLADALDRAKTYADGAQSGRTRAAYVSAFRAFATWCEPRGAAIMPAEPTTVAAYLADMADRGRKAATIDLHVAAITAVHRAAGFDPPTSAGAVRATIKGIRRAIGSKVNRKAPATAEAVKRMLKKIPDTTLGKRDRAIILLGFSAALRRSEISALRIGDLDRVADGIIVHIRKSKTDQEGEGHEVAVPRGSKLKPCEAVDEWIEAAAITDGPLFRPVGKGGRVGAAALSDHSVAQIVKDRAAAAGLDPKLFAGHSLRAGFVTSALEAGADILRVMDVTRHTQVDTLKAYDRRAKAFKNHAGRGFL